MSFRDPLIDRAQRILEENRAIRSTMTLVTPRLMGMAIEEMPAAAAKLKHAEKMLRAARLDIEGMRSSLGAAVGHLAETTSLSVGQENQVTDLVQLVKLLLVAFEADPEVIAVFLNALGSQPFEQALRSLDESRLDELASIIEAVRAT